MKYIGTISLMLLCCIGYTQPRQYLVAGQSNARGRGVASLAPTVDPMTSFEYHPNLNQLIHLADPVGVSSGGFQQAATGSAWPAFAKKYHDVTGDTTIIIQTASGGSGIHPISSVPSNNWSSSGLLYTLSSFRVNQAIALTNQNLDGIIWLQGETDASRINFGGIGQAGYRDALIDLIGRFRNDYGCHIPFYIVLVGANTTDSPAGYNTVRAAQQEVADILPHTYVIHEEAQNFPALGWMTDNVHYNQDGYNHVGEVGALNLAAFEDIYYEISASTNDTICSGDNIVLTAPSIYEDYIWSTGDSTNHLVVTEGGTYSVTVTDDNGCTFPLKNKVIHQHEPPRPRVNLSVGDALCVGDSLKLHASSGLGYLWSTGETSASISVNNADYYFVQIIDILTGCWTEPSDSIFLYPTLTLASDTPATFCESDSVQLSAPAGFSGYQWSTGDNTQSTVVYDTNVVFCTVTDANGCTSVASTTPVFSPDNIPPTIICPENITVNTAPTACGTLVNWDAPTYFDNCSDATLTSSVQSGTIFLSGITPVIYTVTDAAGNETTCSFDVIVVDDEAPTIECPESVTVSADTGNCSAVVTWDTPAYSDNCSGTTLTSSVSSGTVFSLGTTVVTYTATDATGNETMCSFGVTVVDNEAPRIECPADITVSAGSGSCNAFVLWEQLDYSDNCPGATINSVPQGGMFSVGTTPVIYTVTDAAGNTNTCSFDVTVLDEEAPIISCPADISIDVEEGACTAIATWAGIVVTDNCSVNSLSVSHQSGSTFPIGCTTVTYTASDDSNNTAACSFEVCVNECAEGSTTSTETITLISDMDVFIGAADTENFADNSTYTFTDPATPANAVISNATLQLFFRVENASCENDIEIQLTDPAGNMVMTRTPFNTCNGSGANPFPGQLYNMTVPVPSAAFTGNVADWILEFRDTDDQNAGAVEYSVRFGRLIYDATVTSSNDPIELNNCPTDTRVSMTSDSGAVVNWTSPTVTSGCSTRTLSSNYQSGDEFPIGCTTVTYTVDCTTISCSFEICVEACDQTPTTETITLISDMDLFIGANDTENFADNSTYTFTDPATPANAVISNATLQLFFRVENASCENDIEIQLTDPAGNTVITTTPFNTCTGSGANPFPGQLYNVTVPVSSAAFTGNVADWILEFRDTDDQNTGAVEYSVRFGRLIYDATVTSGNDPIQLNNCPADTSVFTMPGTSAAVNWTAPTVTGGCAVPTLNSNYQSGDEFPIGCTTVTYTVDGTSVSCDFEVCVEACDQTPTTETITLISDMDVFIGAADTENFADNPTYTFTDPATPANAIISNATLQLFFRVENASCENDIEIQLTDPAGNTVMTTTLFTTCNGSGTNPFPGQLYNVTVPVPSAAFTGNVADWILEFRDMNDQNAGAVEYSVRFGRLIYDATVTPDCMEMLVQDTHSTANQRLQQSTPNTSPESIKCYPVPTTGRLFLDYFSNKNKIINIKIINTNNQILLVQKANIVEGINTIELDIQNLSGGMYYIQTVDERGKMHIESFVKLMP